MTSPQQVGWKIAVSLGADVNSVNKAGNTALHGAASNGYPEVVRLLADKGAKLDVRNNRGQVPLSLTYHTRIVKEHIERDRKSTQALLLKLGAKPLDQSEINSIFEGRSAGRRENPSPGEPPVGSVQ